MMRLSLPARERLKRLEGFRAKAYIPVPGDRATIGYGFTDGVKIGDRMTREEADARLVEELRPYEMAVWQGCTLEPNQNEFDAMVLLCFNIGPAGFKKSTVLKAHNRGDHQAAARAFGLWNKSGGKVYAGLTKRRAEESALYLTPMPDDVSDPPEGPIAEMPQTVDAESRMTESPINRAGVVAGGTAAVATVAETARTVAEVKYSVSSLGDWLVPLLLVAVVVLCGYVVWQRVNQRREGWT
jgi:lysozyme